MTTGRDLINAGINFAQVFYDYAIDTMTIVGRNLQ